jgi:glycosyltransferase involved in cell wall biosynthesis
VLCSDIPENTLVTEDRAMLFEKSNVDDLTSKLQEMCDNEALVTNLKQGVDDFILGKYSWLDIATETATLYKKVLGN